MTQTELLREAIRKITRHAGIDTPDAFHVTPVFLGSRGIFIMQTIGAPGRRIYEALERMVPGFPGAGDPGCVALLPDVVERIISAVEATHREASSIRGENAAVKPLPYLCGGNGRAGAEDAEEGAQHRSAAGERANAAGARAHG